MTGRAPLVWSTAALLVSVASACFSERAGVAREPPRALSRSSLTSDSSRAGAKTVGAVQAARDADSRIAVSDTELAAACGAFDATNMERIERIHKLYVVVRMARTDRELQCVRLLVERFYPELARRRPPPSTADFLGEWWATVQSALREDFAPDEFVVLPDPPRRLSAKDVLTKLSPLLCSDHEPHCGLEARAFLTECEDHMARFGELHSAKDRIEEARTRGGFLTDDEARLAECRTRALATEKWSAFGVWSDCVEQLVPKVTLTPRNAFRMPERGSLLIDRSGYWNPCRDVAGYSLASGVVLSRVVCGNREQPNVRWRFGRIHPGAIRRIALFAALMEEMRDSPAYARAFTIPRTLALHKDHHHRVTSRRFVQVSDALELHYGLYGVLPVPLADELYAHHEIEPRRRLLAGALQALERAVHDSCARGDVRAEIEQLLNKMRARSELGPNESVASVFGQVRCT